MAKGVSMAKVYRGVSIELYKELKGKIAPKGTLSELGSKWGAFVWGRETWGSSKTNAVLEHQNSEGDDIKLCYVSTSESFDQACYFATSGNMSNGVVFVLDRELFDKYGVEVIPILEAENEHEQEVTIKAADGGYIPHSVIIGAIAVNP
jgi:hypothetical protein